ncbi:biopolymer transporter ExbD [Bdellovibrionota bacterium FG-1]
MAGGFGNSSDEDFISGINVTPLVDVVLVLLIIFMITAPAIYQSAIKVQLPKAKTGQESPKSPFNFTITKDGQLSWDKTNLTWDELGKRLATLSATVTDQTALITADEATPHGTVIKLMDALRQAGLTHFALNVEIPH